MVETADRKQQLINKQAIIIVDLKANLEQAALALEVRDATFTELRKNLLKAAAEANRTTGTSPAEEADPPGGGQDQAGPPANLAVPSGKGQRLAEMPAPLEGHESAGQEKDEEVFLANEGR